MKLLVTEYPLPPRRARLIVRTTNDTRNTRPSEMYCALVCTPIRKGRRQVSTVRTLATHARPRLGVVSGYLYHSSDPSISQARHGQSVTIAPHPSQREGGPVVDSVGVLGFCVTIGLNRPSFIAATVSLLIRSCLDTRRPDIPVASNSMVSVILSLEIRLVMA